MAEEVRRRFRAILIDEFQDTSRLQQKIVDLVRRPNAFFAVGDVKQSVYGFRHAEVRGLLEVEEEVRRTGGLVVPLDTSFRTRPSVLAYVESLPEADLQQRKARIPIFKQLMGTDEIPIHVYAGVLLDRHWNDHAGQLAKIRKAVGL